MSCPEYRHQVCQRQVVATTPSSDMKNSFQRHPSQSLTLNVYASKVCLRVGSSTSPEPKTTAFNAITERNFGHQTCDNFVDISHLKCQCEEDLVGLVEEENFEFCSFSNW